MPGYLESILDISESCDYFFALECCQRKVDSCWKGGWGGVIPENVTVDVREDV